MKALMLAAGIGRRLAVDGGWRQPKVLLPFGARSLLARHVEILQEAGATELVIVTGYRAEEVAAEAERTASAGFVRMVSNPRFEEGSILSLHAAAALLRAAREDVLYMDADVLYHEALVARLTAGGGAGRIPYDRGFEPGDEPVKVCLREGRVVDFGKAVAAPHDVVGEWPGFLHLSAEAAGGLADAAAAVVEAGATEAPAEDAIRRWLLDHGADVVPVDVTGVPWIEIDFAADVERAEREILPRLPR